MSERLGDFVIKTSGVVNFNAKTSGVVNVDINYDTENNSSNYPLGSSVEFISNSNINNGSINNTVIAPGRSIIFNDQCSDLSRANITAKQNTCKITSVADREAHIGGMVENNSSNYPLGSSVEFISNSNINNGSINNTVIESGKSITNTVIEPGRSTTNIFIEPGRSIIFDDQCSGLSRANITTNQNSCICIGRSTKSQETHIKAVLKSDYFFKNSHNALCILREREPGYDNDHDSNDDGFSGEALLINQEAEPFMQTIIGCA
jgi:hypothetical protein